MLSRRRLSRVWIDNETERLAIRLLAMMEISPLAKARGGILLEFREDVLDGVASIAVRTDEIGRASPAIGLNAAMQRLKAVSTKRYLEDLAHGQLCYQRLREHWPVPGGSMLPRTIVTHTFRRTRRQESFT